MVIQSSRRKDLGVQSPQRHRSVLLQICLQYNSADIIRSIIPPESKWLPESLIYLLLSSNVRYQYCSLYWVVCDVLSRSLPLSPDVCSATSLSEDSIQHSSWLSSNVRYGHLFARTFALPSCAMASQRGFELSGSQ